MTRKQNKPRYGLCPKCKQGQMKPDGIAIDKDYSRLPKYKVTMSSLDGDAKIINCFKCHKCGYSEEIR